MAVTTLGFNIVGRDISGVRTFERVGVAARTSESRVNSFGSAFAKIGGRIATASRTATIATAAMGAGILKVGVAYQDSLNTLQAVTHSTTSEMDAAAAKAKQLGANLQLPATSAADAAAAMTELAKGGLSVRQAMQASLGTLQLATAAQVDGATAAQIQVAALNQFGLSATSASHVADVLANTANAAAGEITDMADALSYVGPVAHAFGVNIDATAASIGLLAKGGIIGEKAGVALRGILAGLANPSAQAAAALKVLNIQAFTASGQFKGMRYIVGALTKAHQNLSEAQFGQASTAAFSRRQLAAVNVLATQGVASFDAMSKAVARQGGAAQVSAAKMKGLHGAWEGLKSQLETVAITIFTAVAPALTRMLHFLADAVPKVSAFFGSVKSGNGPLSQLVGWFRGALIPALERLGQGLLPHLQRAWNSISQTIQNNHGTFVALGHIITNVLLPMLGKLAGILIDTVGPAFQGVVFILRRVLIPAFVFMTHAWLVAVGAILRGASRAFGWLPGVGPKLRRASASFDEFAGQINASLDKIQRDIQVNVHVQPVVEPVVDASVHNPGFIGPTIAESKQARGIAGPFTKQERGVYGPSASAQAKSAAITFGKSVGAGLGTGLSDSAKKVSDGGKKVADAAKAKFDEIKQAADSLRSSVHDSVMGFFSLQTEGNPFAGLGAMAAKATRFAHALALLSREGVNPSVIAMIAQAGPDVGYRAAMELSHAGKANRGRINNAYATISRAADMAGSVVVGAQYPGQKTAQDSLNELRAIRKAVTRHHRANPLNQGWSAA